MMDLDDSLKDLGQFGRFQVVYFSLLVFPVVISGFRGTEYIFTTMNIPHRCRVPECEGASGPTQFSPAWLEHTVPGTSECLRYRPRPGHIPTANTSTCPRDWFTTDTQPCSDWVYAEPARSIANDFNITCPKDFWKLTLLSSLNVIMNFVGLPLSGFLSDRLGRKTVMVFASTVISITGIIRSFSVNYSMSAALEVLDGLVSGSIYGPAFVLGLETLSPSKRLLGSMLINLYFPLGEMVLAFIMWAVQDWRLLLRIFYIPMLAVASLYWLLPESVRWLHTRGRYDDVEKVFHSIAKANKTEDRLPNIMSSLRAPLFTDKDQIPKGKIEEPIKSLRFAAVLKSRIIMFRLLICALCWAACIFSYYGISQNVTLLGGGNRYLSFALVSLIEAPAYVASLWVPAWPWLGRRGSLSASFFLCGAACFALMLVTPEQQVLNILLFLVGKFCSTMAVTVIYVYTAEVFPTELRHSLLATCSVAGRVGSISSQQTPLIALYVDPMLVFGVVSVAGGALALLSPETLNTKLPDTIQEAENIGRQPIVSKSPSSIK